MELLDYLDVLNTSKVKFALSNVLKSNGKENAILKKWAEKYTIHYLNYEYNNSNFHRKNESETVEVLITNY